MEEPVVQPFQAEVAQVLKLVVNSLYSHKEIFLRELISNASDALDKLRFRSLSEPELLGEGEQLRVQLSADPLEGTLTIEDNGIGMSREELARNLGTIAWSGSREFAEKLQQAKQTSGDFGLIGQFGVGFYSAYLVASEVRVVSRAAGSNEAHTWASEGKQDFQVTPAEGAERGTRITLKLKPDQREFLEESRLRTLVQKYSDYINYPIELGVEKEVEEGGVKRKRTTFESINRASALWQRPAKDLEKAQYEEFYKHLTHDWEPPLAYRHFRIEGTQMFVGLLFVPGRKPFDLFDPEVKHGVRLHVRRVLIMDNCEELVPRWLRFMRGVIDSEDLPLNVSREILQDSRAVKTIRKQVTGQSLDLLEELARDRKDDYLKFWANFGNVLKEGVYFELDSKERIAALLRYESSREPGLSTLDDYVNRMPEGQPAIYYAAGPSRKVLESGPHLEALNARGYEVLFMTEPVDPFVVEALGEYRNKPLLSASTADLKLEKPAPSAAEVSAREPVLARFKSVLGERVSDVRPSERLTDSPACLVNPEGGLPPHLERILRARSMEVPDTKRILEINLQHPLLRSLGELVDKQPDSAQVSGWIEIVYDQALLAEGSPIEDPVRFAKQIAELVTRAAEREAANLPAKPATNETPA
ncbi:MAG TPA: molecular chaperone HtpG [Polyangiaceae bacterium]|nr:molecular chaperone HtpG [Polyangiaceae bacterium]